jgi:hypothetical protein
VPADDLNSWLAVRQRLAATTAVQSSQLLSLDRHGARVELHYVGSPDQLRVGLAQNNLNLSGNDPDWVLQRGGAALRDVPTPPPPNPAPGPALSPGSPPAPAPQPNQ